MGSREGGRSKNKNWVETNSETGEEETMEIEKRDDLSGVYFIFIIYDYYFLVKYICPNPHPVINDNNLFFFLLRVFLI